MNWAVAQAGLPTDVQGQSYVSGIVLKAHTMINMFIRNGSERDPDVLLDRLTGKVHVDAARVRLGQLVETRPVDSEQIQKWVNQFLDEFYSPFVYETVSPVCREWLWALHGHVLRATLALFLVWTRIRQERFLSTDRTELPLPLLLFLSDAQVYGVEQKEVLKSRVDVLCAGLREQGKPLLDTYFAFPIKK